MKIRLLSQDDIRQALTIDRAIELMEDAFVALSRGTVQVPVRTNLSNDSGALLYKPALMPSSNLFAMKAVSVFPDNSARGLPVTTGLILINDGGTGLPVALMDAEYLTALRTGAATGLATRLLANPDTKTAALFGTGGQAPLQLQAMLSVLPLKIVYVFSRHAANAEALCERHAEQSNNCQLIPAQSHNVLKNCGVITTATSSPKPVFSDQDIAPGTHINGIGSFRPDMIEVPNATVCRSTVFVDHQEAALKEAGDIIEPIARGDLPRDFTPTELGDLLLNDHPGRTHPKQITFFKSVGNAAQDIVCAGEILSIAEQQQIGRIIEL